MKNKITTPDEVNQFVLDLTSKVYNEITLEILRLPIDQQFLVKSRVVSLIYHTHFSESLESMDDRIIRHKKDQEGD